MFSKSSLLVGLLASSQGVIAQFHTISYFTSYFIEFEGTLIVPSKVPSGGTPYVWPGLQPPNNSGVLQNVLDGRDSYNGRSNENWYYGNTWEGTPSEPYGGGLEASVNESLGFSMVETPEGSGNWSITSSGGGQSVSYTFDIQTRMNQALFAVELYDNSWDFGEVVFQDVTIVSDTTDTSWCTSSPQYSDVTITVEGVSSSVNNGYATCTIQQVTLSPP